MANNTLYNRLKTTYQTPQPLACVTSLTLCEIMVSIPAVLQGQWTQGLTHFAIYWSAALVFLGILNTTLSPSNKETTAKQRHDIYSLFNVLTAGFIGFEAYQLIRSQPLTSHFLHSSHIVVVSLLAALLMHHLVRGYTIAYSSNAHNH